MEGIHNPQSGKALPGRKAGRDYQAQSRKALPDRKAGRDYQAQSRKDIYESQGRVADPSAQEWKKITVLISGECLD